jgi:hypothetical protein
MQETQEIDDGRLFTEVDHPESRKISYSKALRL